jgi:dUTP pyrophosphatase
LTAKRKYDHIEIGETMHPTAIRIEIKKLHSDATIPTYATEGASGFDLVAVEEVVIAPGKTELVKTGLAIEIPNGYELQIRPRSGLSLTTNLRISNSPGTIDSDYRGEICVIVSNIGSTCHDKFRKGCGCIRDAGIIVKKGDRIAQGVICPVVKGLFAEVSALSETSRSDGGFGSTGK